MGCVRKPVTLGRGNNIRCYTGEGEGGEEREGEVHKPVTLGRGNNIRCYTPFE